MTMALDFRRDVAALEQHSFDVAVIGGGVIGASIARDAARRGLSVALVEAGDFCAATSEAMSHFVHGGIRYLAQGQFGHLRQSLAERAVWRKIAPHMVSLQPCLTPVAGKGFAATGMMRAAVGLFNLAGGRNILPSGEAQGSWLDAAETVHLEPVLEMPGLRGALLYHDCRIDEPERIVLALLQDAAVHGAVVANHVEATGLDAGNDRTLGARIRDRIGEGEGFVRAAVVVNAAGAWSARLADRFIPGQKGVTLTLSKGIHLVTDAFAATHALNLAGRGEHAAILPWRGKSLIGTTDDLFAGDPSMLAVEQADVDRLVAKVERLLPAMRGRLAPIHDRFAGLRALPGATTKTYSAVRDSIIVDHVADGAPGFVTVTGGKWTTARFIAEHAVNTVVSLLGRPARPCDTAEAPLPHAPSEAPEIALAKWHRDLPSWPRAEVDAWFSAYGTAMPAVLSTLNDPDKSDYSARETARFSHAVWREMAVKPEDVARRLARWYDIEHPGVAGRAAAWMAAGGN